MRLRFSAIIILCFALGACGTTRKPGQSTPPGYSSSRQGGDRIILPSGHKPPVAEDRDLPGSPSDLEAKQQKIVRDYPEIRFTAFESANVRVGGINPLPAGGILEVCLDSLKDDFCFPIHGRFLSPYGPRGNAMHTGVDIKAQPGDTIRAALPGVVRMSKMYSSYGNIVVIQHYCGFETLYSHNSENLVQVNEVVEAGTPIALAGRTGRATTEHLHFEVRAAGEHIDPCKLIDVEAGKLRDGWLCFRFHEGRVLGYNTESEFIQLAENLKTKQEADNKAVANAEAKKKSGDQSSGSKATYHTVKKGDTLSGIAKRHSTTVRKLCQLNGIKETSILSINQKIRVK